MKRKNRKPAAPAFDFSAYMYALERALPKRSKARKLIPELETYVDTLRREAKRPWESVDPTSTASIEYAEITLFESVLKIPPRVRFRIGVQPAILAASVAKVPEAERDVKTLLNRTRSFESIDSFTSLRLRGLVSLNKARSRRQAAE